MKIPKTSTPSQGEEYHGLTALHLAIAYGNDELAEVGSALLGGVAVDGPAQVLVQAGAPITARARGTFFHPKYLYSD